MAGHVFVIHGVVDNLDYDAVVVPTDEAFSVRSYWDPVVGASSDRGSRPSPHAKPATWERCRFGRSSDGGEGGGSLPVWYVAAAHERGDQGESLRLVMDRLRRVLADISVAGVLDGDLRSNTLVAVTPLGIGGGGFDEIRGAVVDELLGVCADAVMTSGIDVVIVAKDASIYSALQARRRAKIDALNGDAQLLGRAQELADLARKGELVLFLGAGLSKGAGLPDWKDLLKQLGKVYGVGVDDLDSDLDKAELLSLRGKAAKVETAGEGGTSVSTIGEEVAKIIGGKTRFSLAHGLLAALRYREVVTTNYDRLYETAARGVAHDGKISSLPFEQATAGRPWVLKMHGDVDHPESIVLTRTDFVRYDALSKPLGAILQSLMATKHVLVVGTSMTDDNFLRLAYEVLDFRAAQDAAHNHDPTPIGTVVTLGEQPAKAELWAKRFDYLPVSGGGDGVDAPRDLAIFLDLVAMHAAGQSHLLDARFGNLLGSDAVRAVAAEARALRSQILDLSGEGGQPDAAWKGGSSGARRGRGRSGQIVSSLPGTRPGRISFVNGVQDVTLADDGLERCPRG